MTKRQPKGTPVGGQFAQERKPHGDDLAAPTSSMVEDADGAKRWYRNGQLHRDDGPAVERADGTKEWWLDGQLHRDDGPAVEWADGTKVWWLDGRPIQPPEGENQ